MKKFYILSAAMLFFAPSIFAQCTPNNANMVLFNPDPDNVPCARQGTAYDQTLHFYVPVSQDISILGYTVTVYVDSVIMTNVTGLPTGLSWVANPVGPLYMPGTHGCGRTTGTTNAAVGNYPISFVGMMYMHGSLLGYTLDTALTLDQVITNQYGKTFSIDVIAANGFCAALGVNDFKENLNSILSVYPNPSNGKFEINLNAADRINGELVITDITGKRVYEQTLDVTGLYNTSIDLSNLPKGLYAIQLRTAEGFASKNISIE